MRARLLLAAALPFLVPHLLWAADDNGLQYTPPAYAEAPAVGPMLVKLTVAAVVVLLLCVGMMWLARRGLLGAAPPAAGNRLRLTETMTLGGGSFLFLLHAGGKQYVAGVNRGGLQVLMPLTEPFEQALATAAEEVAA